VSEQKNNLTFYWNRLLDERVRTYVVVTAAALMVIFVAQIMSGSLIAGLIPLIMGATALGLRWTAMPVLCVVAVAWFQALPFGVPVGRAFNQDPRFTHFRMQDLLLGAAVVVYLIAQYRVYTLAHMAVPDERDPRFRKANALPDRRDPDLIDEREVPQLLVTAAVVLVAGQVAWLVLSETVLDFRQLPPIRLRPAAGVRFDGAHSLATSRWLLFVITFGVTIFLARLAFWYWRIRTLNRAEAQLVLADTGWSEMRREAARQETWRAFGKYRHRPAPPRPKLKPKPRPDRPWLGAAVVRGCLIVVIAVAIALLMVCAGVWIMDARRSQQF
jgi:hypothetical protein